MNFQSFEYFFEGFKISVESLTWWQIKNFFVFLREIEKLDEKLKTFSYGERTFLVTEVRQYKFPRYKFQNFSPFNYAGEQISFDISFRPLKELILKDFWTFFSRGLIPI